MSMRLPATFLLFPLLFLSTIYAHHPKFLCIDNQKHALLDFKLSFVADLRDSLSTWRIETDDCCGWKGVGCHPHSGHVTSLALSSAGLISYKLRPSLLQFQHLESLDLSGNQFHMRIPNFIGSLGELSVLDLSDAGFFGEVPPHLGNLSKLHSLTLGHSNYPIWDNILTYGLYSNNLQWLSRLSLLESVDLGYVNLRSALDWASVLKKLPSLFEFDCRTCSLPPPIISPSTSHVNFSTALDILDLSNNSVSSSTFSYLINGSTNFLSLSLDYMELDDHDLHEFLEALNEGDRCTLLLDLSLVGNNLTKLPFGMMFPSLTNLQLSFNQISELYPQDLVALSSLMILDLSFNRISGSLPEILQHLSTNLTSLYGSSNFIIFLDVSSNLLSGTISETHLSKFSQLGDLRLSDNNLLTLNFSKSWVPPFQLGTLELRSCKVGPRFPNWILLQTLLSELDISNSMISGSIPDAFWDFSTRLYSLNLSHNNISGIIPNSNLPYSHYNSVLDLSHNAFHGPVPLFLFKTAMLYLSNNRFSSFPSFNHGVLSLVATPYIINLSNNHLFGSLPNWIFQLDELLVLHLDNNKLSGALPEAIGSLSQLRALHLSNNKFSGRIPLSMRNCTHLIILELENNKFSGVVPFWLREGMTQLVALNLRSNVFSGNLPSSLCHLQSLQILDLSDNKISGTIPNCVNNLTHMATNKGINLMIAKSFTQLSRLFLHPSTDAIDDVSIAWKGELVALKIQSLMQRNVINLSSNCLVGEIPKELAALKGLRALDVSRNGLNGSIPDAIGQLTSLEVLKLSSNRLWGGIPASLASLSFLGTLNLSNNNLSGRIPKSTQLQSFDASSYAGNPNLCGQPLPICPGDESDRQPPFGKVTSDEEDESFDIQTFLAASGAGFAFGVLGVLGMLHFNRQWRLAFFQSMDCVADRIFVVTSLSKSKIKRSLCLR